VIQSGADEDDSDLVFDDLDEAQIFIGLVMRHWNTITRTLKDGVNLSGESNSGIHLLNSHSREYRQQSRLRALRILLGACGDRRQHFRDGEGRQRRLDALGRPHRERLDP
jgi:hypothetical protein